MPNHVTNILAVKSGDPTVLFDRIKGPEDNQLIDFNRIVQMPEIMEAESSTPAIEDLAKLFCGHYSLRELLTPSSVDMVGAFESGDYGTAADALKQSNLLRQLFETKLAGDLSDDDFEVLVKYMRAFRQFGHCSWYEWSCENWGTKWNAYDQSQVDESTIKFDTAWSTPKPIWLKLSEMFPEHRLYIRWADEDFGNNTGSMEVFGGRFEGGPLDNGSPDAYSNAVDVVYDGELPSEYRWNADGTAEYVEE